MTFDRSAAAVVAGKHVHPSVRAMVVPAAGAKLRLEERELPQPQRHEVRIRVHACGVCHSDALTVQGHMPGLKYPRIPGHEVIGTLDAVGADGAGLRHAERREGARDQQFPHGDQKR